MLKVTGNTPDAPTRQFATAFEAARVVLELAVREGGCQVEDTTTGHIFLVTHVADRPGLERRACECYGALEKHFAAVIGPHGDGSAG